ncbi:hypothetical protein JI435_059820, partial [Parastagonospora nodorum SN15]
TRFSLVLRIPKIGVRPYARMSTPARDPGTSKVTYLFIYIGAKIYQQEMDVVSINSSSLVKKSFTRRTSPPSSSSSTARNFAK